MTHQRIRLQWLVIFIAQSCGAAEMDDKIGLRASSTIQAHGYEYGRYVPVTLADQDAREAFLFIGWKSSPADATASALPPLLIANDHGLIEVKILGPSQAWLKTATKPRDDARITSVSRPEELNSLRDALENITTLRGGIASATIWTDSDRFAGKWLLIVTTKNGDGVVYHSGLRQCVSARLFDRIQNLTDLTAFADCYTLVEKMPLTTELFFGTRAVVGSLPSEAWIRFYGEWIDVGADVVNAESVDGIAINRISLSSLRPLGQSSKYVVDGGLPSTQALLCELAKVDEGRVHSHKLRQDPLIWILNWRK